MKQREIKFRVWVKSESKDDGTGEDWKINRMFYPEDGDKNSKPGFRPTMLKFGSQLEIDTNREQHIFMQYTELKDKNGKGKEMYHKDICMHAQEGLAEETYLERYIIEFGEYDEGEYDGRINGYGWYLQNSNDPRDIYPLNEPIFEMKVIGNIYENANLLK